MGRCLGGNTVSTNGHNFDILYANLSIDYWKAQANLGLEWELRPFVLALNGFGAYYLNDWGPVSYRGQGIVIGFKRGMVFGGNLPVGSTGVAAWEVSRDD